MDGLKHASNMLGKHSILVPIQLWFGTRLLKQPWFGMDVSYQPNSLNKNGREPAYKFVGLVPSEPTSLCYILQNKFVGLVPSQLTNLSAGS
jgi:hypothetical protein